ncbi:MAG: extracellular solute-binding protein [Thermomicrobiales bacterium]
MRDEQRSPWVPREFGRRSILRIALGGAATAASAALLAACGARSSPTATPAPTTTPNTGPPVPIPRLPPTVVPTSVSTAIGTAPAASVAVTTASGTLPSPAPNVPNAYLTPPAPFKSVAVIPGRGGTVSITKASQRPPAVPHDQNQWWQELEKRMGTRLDITLVPLPQYSEKATALIAAGDIPDILLISPLSAPDQYKAVQQGAFTDLTSSLSSDALLAYPNLARYPASAWKNAAIRGRLYGVPRLGLAIGPALLYRQDWAEKLGLPAPKNADEILNLFTAMTKNDPDGNGKPDTWALGSQGADWSMPFLRGMFRVPNGWRKNADGTLTNQIETDAFRQSLAFARRLFAAGVYYPDAVTLNRTQATTALISGKIGGYADQLMQLNGDIRLRYEAKRVVPTANVGALVPPGFEGGKGVTYNGTGFGSIAAIPAKDGKDPERIKELLRVLDYFSAPFGSEEYNFLAFGIEGVHHTIQPDGTRILNDRGRAEIGELGTVVVPPPVFYYPSDPGDAQYLQTAAAQIAALGIENPALTAFSPTSIAKSAELNQLGTDRVTAIITGRDPLAALDQYVKDWRSRGGDLIRKECEQEISGQG